MHPISILYGAALVVLGLAGYALTGAVSVTALIPAFFGVAVLAFALPARKRPRLEIGAVVVAVLGLGGTLSGLLELPSLLDGSAERPAAVASQATLAVLSITYLVLQGRRLLARRSGARAEGA